jgi:hypothetical protein
VVEAQVGDELGPRRRRLVLGGPAWEANRLVTGDRLITLVSPDDPPRSAAHAHLRVITGTGVLC